MGQRKLTWERTQDTPETQSFRGDSNKTGLETSRQPMSYPLFFA